MAALEAGHNGLKLSDAAAVRVSDVEVLFGAGSPFVGGGSSPGPFHRKRFSTSFRACLFFGVGREDNWFWPRPFLFGPRKESWVRCYRPIPLLAAGNTPRRDLNSAGLLCSNLGGLHFVSGLAAGIPRSSW